MSLKWKFIGSLFTWGVSALMILFTIANVKAAYEGSLLNKKAPEIEGEAWINSKPLKIGDLKGRVVLVDFWEYTCVNCIRTFPYVTEWHKRYADKGLVIIGVHTPEFEFGKKLTNVKDAVDRFGIKYPVVLDNEYKTWTNYQNQYWPRKYLVDKDGTIRYDHIGEGGYGVTEKKIQELLKEVNPGVQFPPVMDPIRGADKPGAVCYPVTPELYCGYGRGRIGNPKGYSAKQVVEYNDPGNHTDGYVYLNGKWFSGDEFLRHGENTEHLDDFVAIKYHALEVNAVIKPSGIESFRVEVTQDGKAVGHDDRGEDLRVDSDGRTFIHVQEPKMYNIIRNKSFGTHELRIASKSDQFEIYAYTFSSCEVE
ncbi:MAG TPA: redoxin family protein [Bacteroidota bacterium]